MENVAHEHGTYPGGQDLRLGPYSMMAEGKKSGEAILIELWRLRTPEASLSADSSLGWLSGSMNPLRTKRDHHHTPARLQYGWKQSLSGC